MRHLLLTLASTVLFVSTGFAETFILVPGQSFRLDGVTASDVATFTAFDGRSYCCQITAAGSGSNLRFNAISVSSGSLVNESARGKIDPWIPSNFSDTRRCFRFVEAPSENGIGDVVLEIEATGTINNVTAECRETTLFGGFNTSVTDFNFIEITNTLTPNTTVNDDGQVVVHVEVRGTANTILFTADKTLAAGTRQDIDVHSMVGGKDFGPVLITHNGPPGAIRAVNAQYRIVTTTPLDFEPVLVVPFREGRP